MSLSTQRNIFRRFVDRYKRAWRLLEELDRQKLVVVSRPKPGRSPTNDWQDAVMGEIELGSFDAYVGMSCDGFDMGLNQMHLWYMFENDDRAERGLPPTNETPWGPYYAEGWEKEERCQT